MKQKAATGLKWTTCALLWAILAAAQGGELVGQGRNPKLSLELQTMRVTDQAIRDVFEKTPDDPEVIKRLTAIDDANRSKISAILKEYGWPSKEDVGQDGIRSIWFLIQHSGDELIHEAIPLMQKAAEQGELPWQAVALSIDRDLVNQGEKQRYGSQFKIDGDHLVPYPLENPEEVDRRRKDVGLNTMEEYRLQLLESYPTLK